MSMQKLDRQGDPLERAYHGFIASRLPGYVVLWAAFIGNDGTSHLPIVPGETAAQRQLRALTSEYSYTALESAVSAHRIVDSASKLRFSQLKGSKAVKKYLLATEAFIAFYAHIGRICDSVEKLGNTWNAPKLADPLREYYKQRNVVLHEAKTPTGILESSLFVAIPEGAADDPEKWGKQRRWSAADQLKNAELTDHLSATESAVLNLLNDAYHRVYSEHVAHEQSALLKALARLTPAHFASLTTSASFAMPNIHYGDAVYSPNRKNK